MNAKNIGWIIGVAVVASVGAYLLIWGYAGDFSGSPADHLRNIIFLVGGITAGIVAVWRAQVADKQTQINEQSQITERFTKAVEHLGSENIYMRIGALHALERIGHDSENDVVAILRLLSNFVQKQSPVKSKYVVANVERAPLDAREGFGVISRLAKEYEQLLKNQNKKIVNLFSSNLKGLPEFSKGCFFRFDFARCNLSSGFFPRANFEIATFNGACLKGANFQRCNLVEADFRSADMTGVKLQFAVCNGTNFSTAKNLTTEMLQDIIYDAETPPRVPKGVTLPPPRKKPSGAGQ
ncbi:MAG: pentapeptide repeat-containing protein [Gammaproteobacteria bacterium]|nr:pentapeptide repeat-containing protein [Gammaproteobacteria bacterium]